VFVAKTQRPKKLNDFGGASCRIEQSGDGKRTNLGIISKVPRFPPPRRHTAIYAGLLKQHGSVVERRKAQAQTQAKGARHKSLVSSRRGKQGNTELPSFTRTVTRKVASDLGITDEAVRNRIKSRRGVARRPPHFGLHRANRKAKKVQ
jgi:hypothetical protein